MSSARILVVEDDAKTADTLRLYLEHAGYGVGIAGDGEVGLAEAATGCYALMVLDLLLPGLDGLAVCRELRRLEGSVGRLPIIMLTARTAEEDRIRGLDLGADDYLPKPFSPRELVARVRAVLRRVGPAQDGDVLRAGPLELDRGRHQVRCGGEAVALTPSELKLLEVLARQSERVLTRAQLIEQALGYDFEGDDRTVDAHIKNLRKKLEQHAPRLIHTVFGVGYRFSLDVS